MITGLGKCRTPPPQPTTSCLILQVRTVCSLLCVGQSLAEESSSFLLPPSLPPPSFPSFSPSPFPPWPGIKPTVLPAKQTKWKEARTRPRASAAQGAEVRCFMPEREREASVRTIPAEVCRGLRAMCPVWTVSCGSLKVVLSEVNFCFVFGGKRGGGAKEISCHSSLLPLQKGS